MMLTMPQLQREPPIVERQSLCLSTAEPGGTIHAGDVGFKFQVERHFSTSENNAAEQLIKFKADLRNLDSDDFWNQLMEGLSDMCQAQFAFVSKRILVDDHDSAVEMPPIGEQGSCMMGVALYWNNGNGIKNMARDYKYYAWGAPCTYMRHDKVFLCPEGLSELTADNPNQVPFACDAYLGVPLFADGKCFAHFGMMWTKDGVNQKTLSWGYLEMMLHSMEDLIADRLLAGRGFAKSNIKGRRYETPETSGKVIPMESVTAAQSLKPYARSLSHELRTPMQGVVGMLDVMYATVQEQIEAAGHPDMRNVFLALKDNIETVQDSSKRAMEAADNVVHAYDLNMQIPDTPMHDLDSPSNNVTSYFESRPKMMEGSNILNPYKRRRDSSSTWSFGNPTKIRHVEKSENTHSPLSKYSNIKPPSPPRQTPNGTPDEPCMTGASLPTPADADVTSTPGGRQSNLRDLIPVVINDSLRVGGRPDSAITEPIPLGERIEVRTRSSNGHASQKTIEWRVNEDVPDFVAMDERDLSKLITQVFLNANKYTETGSIRLHARMSNNKRFVIMDITDTGLGIPEDFQPELFKAFAKEDHSLTRSKEGLGLGLLVAKGVARRVGGDIVLVRSSTEGPNRGSEFEIRIPLETGDLTSRAGTPLRGTPETGIAPKSSMEVNGVTSAPSRRSPSPYAPVSPTMHRAATNSQALQVPTLSKLLNAAGLVATSATPPPPSALPPSLFKPAARRTISSPVTKKDISYDRDLAKKYPLTFLVAEDNKINRKLLVNMLGKFGYKDVYEAFDGKEAVRIMDSVLHNKSPKQTNSTDAVKAVDVVLMDLWMPEMDGYEATEKILAMFDDIKLNAVHGDIPNEHQPPIILAVSADVTEAAVDRATRTGMQGYMTKPYMLTDLQRLIKEFCGKHQQVV